MVGGEKSSENPGQWCLPWRSRRERVSMLARRAASPWASMARLRRCGCGSGGGRGEAGAICEVEEIGGQVGVWSVRGVATAAAALRRLELHFGKLCGEVRRTCTSVGLKMGGGGRSRRAERRRVRKKKIARGGGGLRPFQCGGVATASLARGQERVL